MRDGGRWDDKLKRDGGKWDEKEMVDLMRISWKIISSIISSLITSLISPRDGAWSGKESVEFLDELSFSTQWWWDGMW